MVKFVDISNGVIVDFNLSSTFCLNNNNVIDINDDSESNIMFDPVSDEFIVKYFSRSIKLSHKFYL